MRDTPPARSLIGLCRRAPSTTGSRSPISGQRSPPQVDRWPASTPQPSPQLWSNTTTGTKLPPSTTRKWPADPPLQCPPAGLSPHPWRARSETKRLPVQRRAREIHPLLWGVAAAFVLFFGINVVKALFGVH